MNKSEHSVSIGVFRQILLIELHECILHSYVYILDACERCILAFLLGFDCFNVFARIGALT